MPVRPCLDAMDQFAAVFDLNLVTDDTLWKGDGTWVRNAFLDIRAIGSTYEESPPALVPGLAKRSVLVPRPELQLTECARACLSAPVPGSGIRLPRATVLVVKRRGLV